METEKNYIDVLQMIITVSKSEECIKNCNFFVQEFKKICLENLTENLRARFSVFQTFNY